jgi:hypothetical protein
MSKDETRVVLERKLWGAKRAAGRLQLRLEAGVGTDTGHVTYEANWYVDDLGGAEARVDPATALAIVLDGKGKG